ncbi:MAG: NfeD family protein, partial [Cyclobacteriaceae bacterium]
MEWMIVASLIFFGILLVIAEIIFIPGTTVVGIIGAGFMVAGVVSSFSYFGQQGGWITLGATTLSSAILGYYAFKANVWGKFSLKTFSVGKVNEGGLDGLTVGLEGVAISALRPSGKAEISDKTYEVKTLGAFVDSGSRLKIIKVDTNQIIVEPIQ